MRLKSKLVRDRNLVIKRFNIKTAEWETKKLANLCRRSPLLLGIPADFRYVEQAKKILDKYLAKGWEVDHIRSIQQNLKALVVDLDQDYEETVSLESILKSALGVFPRQEGEEVIGFLNACATFFKTLIFPFGAIGSVYDSALHAVAGIGSYILE